jgi:hypothetical protein
MDRLEKSPAVLLGEPLMIGSRSSLRSPFRVLGSGAAVLQVRCNMKILPSVAVDIGSAQHTP